MGRDLEFWNDNLNSELTDLLLIPNMDRDFEIDKRINDLFLLRNKQRTYQSVVNDQYGISVKDYSPNTFRLAMMDVESEMRRITDNNRVQSEILKADIEVRKRMAADRRKFLENKRKEEEEKERGYSVKENGEIIIHRPSSGNISNPEHLNIKEMFNIDWQNNGNRTFFATVVMFIKCEIKNYIEDLKLRYDL